MQKLYNTDSYKNGAIIGLALPIITYLGILAVIYLIDLVFSAQLMAYQDKLKLLAIAANFWPIRYFFVNREFDMSGRAVLLVTFVFAIVFFWIQQS